VQASQDGHPYIVEGAPGRRVPYDPESQVWSIAEFYAQADAREPFAADPVAAWVKLMELDRFDLGSWF
jgi:hypothetical protein